MKRCALCRKKTETLTEHNLCEECESKFDFNQSEPYDSDEDYGSAKNQLKRILITAGCTVGLILFLIWAIPFMVALLGVKSS